MGEDYARVLEDALAEIPEDTPDKAERLKAMAAAELRVDMPEEHGAQERWIGRLHHPSLGGRDNR